MEPFRADGFTSSGIYLAFDERLPPVLGRVITVGRSRSNIRPGDVILYRHHTYDDVLTASMERFAVIDEHNIAAILEGYDEETRNIKELAALGETHVE
jgi:co-chaperonin GroES (HSP10)